MRKAVDGPAYIMQSVDQALRLIELFINRKRLRVMDVVNELHVAPATASRLVAMLELYGYVQRDPRATGYVLGERLRRSSKLALTDFDLYSPVQPCLEVLAAETGETAQFGVLHGSTVVFVGCVEGRHQLRIASHVGVLWPAHALSTGKVLLSALPAEQLAALYPEERLNRVTDRTIISRKRLFADLDRVRRDGFATSSGESEDDIYAVAMAVSDAVGRARGALSVAAPVSRSGERQRLHFVRMLRSSAKELALRFT
jgi:DNA-binding IclR family transcriptional regulator